MSLKEVKLGEVCLVKRGTTITQKQAIEGDIPVVAGGLKPTYYHNQQNRFGTTISVSGSGANAGFVNLWKQPIFASDCSTVEVKNSELDIQYVYYFLLSKQEYIYKKLRSGAAQPHVYGKDIAELLIPIPALATQQKIVEKLDAIFAEIDKAVAATEANIKNAEALFESYLTKVFEKNEDAKNYKLDDVVTRLTNGYVGATKNIYLDSGIPYLLARHVKNNVLKFDERTYISEEFNRKNKKSILKKDDVLLVQSGHIGHSAVVPIEHEGHNCHAMIVISTIKDILSGEFLSLYFQSNKMRNLFENMRTGSTIKHLNCGDVKLLMIPIPSIEIQNKIIGDAKTIEALVTSIKKNLTEKITQLNYLRESILRQAFNGELIKE